MPRLLNMLGFLAFVTGAVGVAFAAYALLAGVIGWNPFAARQPEMGGVTVSVALAAGMVLLAAGAALGTAAARWQWRREMRQMVAP